jgi:hypothetical protein
MPVLMAVPSIHFIFTYSLENRHFLMKKLLYSGFLGRKEKRNFSYSVIPAGAG